MTFAVLEAKVVDLLKGEAACAAIALVAGVVSHLVILRMERRGLHQKVTVGTHTILGHPLWITHCASHRQQCHQPVFWTQELQERRPSRWQLRSRG